MKKLLSFLLFLSLATFVSCTKDSVPVELSASVMQLKPGADAQTIKITIKSTANWSIPPVTENWYTVSPSSGKAGDTEVNIAFTDNFSSGKRSSAVSFKAGDKTSIVQISQDKQLVMNTSLRSYALDFNGGTVAVASSYSANYEVSFSPAVDWFSLSQVAQVSKFTITPNLTDEDRIVKLILKQGAETKEFLITQAGKNANNRLLELRELKIDGIKSIKEMEQKQFYFPVDMDLASPVLSHKIEFEGIGVDYLKVIGSEQKIHSGDTFTFPAFSAKTRVVFTAYSDMIDAGVVCTLNITGTPLVDIVAPEDIVDDPKRPCDITLIDPKGRTNTNLVYFHSFAGIEFRGAGSQLYPKKAFGFELRDKTTNESVDGTLLGLRDDADWILDAMWLDNAKMRNRVCFDVWNEFNVPHYKAKEAKATTGTHGYLVEVFLNGRYHGMYMLSDKLDRKQLKLKKDGGFLYKSVDWNDECILQGRTSEYDNNSLWWNGVESDYPKVVPVNFKYYSDLLTFVSSASNEEFSTNLSAMIDINGLVDYFIFTNLIVAYDNLGKNTFWSIYNVATSTKMTPLMWDMDGTLGRSWNKDKEDPNSGFTLQNRHNWKNYKLFERIINDNPANIHAAIKARWAELKVGALESSNVNAKFDYYKRQQVDSGAHDREIARWSTGYGDIDTEVAYMKDWYSKRLVQLDQLINGLSPQ